MYLIGILQNLQILFCKNVGQNNIFYLNVFSYITKEVRILPDMTTISVRISSDEKNKLQELAK